ncbi:MAG TPA: tetratricopeptide repeat protein [Bacteroidia bacterium]|jgi:TolA-binding protein|nr:tetratricopeptide repeat protein [Bacteroidia bacterium]
MKIRSLTCIFSLSGLLFIASCGPTAADKAKVEADSLRAQTIRKAHPNKDQYLAQVHAAEARIKNSKTFEPQIADAAVRAYIDYANIFQNDTLSSDYLFRAAELAAACGNYDQAIALYENLTDRYPTYKYVVEAIYQEAMIYDSNLSGQDAKAKILYEKIISDYPKHKLAADARTAIANLGKSDEELVKEFEMKNHTK